MTDENRSLLSPKLGNLLADLESTPDESNRLLSSFWDSVKEQGTPLIEPSENDGVSFVTWLYRETDRGIRTIRLQEPFSWKPDSERQFKNLPSSDVWYLTWRVRNDLRGSYGFVIDWIDGIESESILDSLAREFEGDGWDAQFGKTAVLVMPSAAPLTWRHADESLPRGETHELQWTSDIRQNTRRIWVHTPHGFSQENEPYPFVVIFDGEEPGHPAPEVIDNLIAAGKIPPIVTVMVDQIEIRDQELPGNPEFSRAIATELVPWLRAQFNLSSDPKDGVLNGGSYGGFCSGYTALHHSEVFGNAIMHSPSAWQHPNVFVQWKALPDSPEADPVGQPADIPVFIREFQQSERKPIRLWHECGTVENGPPPARIWQTFANRWLHDILELKGYDTVYREYVGGHDHAWWRGTLAEGLIWVFDRSS